MLVITKRLVAITLCTFGGMLLGLAIGILLTGGL